MSLDFELSFAGFPFRPALSPQLEAKILKYANLKTLLNPPPEQREWQNVLPPAPAMPDLGLNELFYPWGARRFACMRGLMHKDDVTEMLKVVTSLFPSSGYRATSATLKMQSGSPALPVSTPMFVLPPEPLVGLNDNPDLYLITLVDERYWWRWSYITLRSEYDAPSSGARYTWNKTWDQLIQDCATATVATIAADAVEAKYGQPDGSSPFFAFDQPVPPILDAAMAHTGRMLVRQFDGTYKAVKYSAATASAEAMRIIASRELGGLAFTAAQYNEVVAANAPRAVALSRPKMVRVVDGVWDFRAGKESIKDVNIPQGDRTDFLDGESHDSSGTINRKGALFTEWRGQIRQHGTLSPSDIKETLADDWYDWNARNLRETYSSIVAFNPEAGLDALYRYTDARTTVWCDPDNYEYVHFWHWNGTVVNEWPRSALVKVLTVDPGTGEARGRIVYPTDDGEFGGEWPGIKIITYAGSGSAPRLGRTGAGLSLYPNQVLPAQFVRAEDPEPRGSNPTATYYTDGIFQSDGFDPYGSYPPAMGSVWSGDQRLGLGVKHMGALSLNRTSPSTNSGTPPFNWVDQGIVPMGGGVGSNSAPNFTFAHRVGGMAAIGGFNGDDLGFTSGNLFTGVGFGASHFALGSLTLAKLAGPAGALGFNMSHGAVSGFADESLLSMGYGGPGGNDGTLGVGQGAQEYANTRNTRPVADLTAYNPGAIGPGSGAGNYITRHQSEGPGFGVAGYFYAGGGYKTFGEFDFRSPQPRRGQPGGFMYGLTGYAPTGPATPIYSVQVQNAGTSFETLPNGSLWPTGTGFHYENLPGVPEYIGYPADPSGPLAFQNGLYIGGGGNLATLSDVSRAVAAAAGNSSSLHTLSGGTVGLAPDGGLNFYLGGGHYIRMTSINL